MEKIRTSEITPEHLYTRRKFIMGAGALTAGALLFSSCKSPTTEPGAETPFCEGVQAGASTDELGAQLTTCNNIIHYNNFYEFSLGKEDVAEAAKNFDTSHWNIAVGGLVNKPHTFSMEEIVRKFPAEERIYRLRCVEAWSMVIPWAGFPLSKLLKEVDPKPQAKYVSFVTLYDPEQMPGQNERFLEWPYVEGLRLDEAMHDLTILATGLYGKPLPPQDGAPIRLVVPWKYGFKNIKSIVKIDLVEEMPESTWVKAAPNEYGFYANVNPDVSHPRWSQASERRIGQFERIRTILYNGYGDQVASLYAGMDLKKNY